MCMSHQINKNIINHYHHTKTKGDIGLTKVIADLTEKGYDVFAPIGGEHLPYDLIINANNKLLKIQVKYRVGPVIPIKYKQTDFDYFAIYNPEHNIVIYPHISYMGKRINFKIPTAAHPFYWYDDFLNLTEFGIKQKTYKDFGYELTKSISKTEKSKYLKIIKPSKEELNKLIWEKEIIEIAEDFGVSEKAIKKWCKDYEIEKPKRGHWMKINCNKQEINNQIIE